MLTRKEFLRKKLLEISKEVQFQTFQLFFSNPVNNTIEREFFMIKPFRECAGHVNWNSLYKILELETKTVGKNRIINTYPVADFSLTKEAFYSMEMIIVHDYNEVDVSEYSYSHKAGYEDEYALYLIKENDKPRLKSEIIIPIVERKLHGIFTVMNKFKQSGQELVFDEITDDDITKIMNFAADLSRDLTFKIGFRKTAIPSIELNSKEKKLYETIKNDESVVGESVAFQNILKRISKVCFTNDPVLLLGDTGVGKTYFAKLMYKYWQCKPSIKYKMIWDTGRLDVKVHKMKIGGKERIQKQFRNVNIAAIPDTLFESEIFGSVKGAATDIKGRFGVLVEEHGSNLMVLFDEIGDLSSTNQAKLLKCIEEQEIELVGSNVSIPLENVRIIAATNRSDILREDAERTLRKDLIYRFKDIIYIPPINQRIEDIDPLIHDLIKKQDRKVILDENTLNILRNYSYPGNIRELESIISYALSRLKTSEHVVTYSLLPRSVLETAEYEGLFIEEEEFYEDFGPSGLADQDGEQALRDLKTDYETKRKNMIYTYYQMSSKNIAQTAKYTGLSEAHIRRLLHS
ncbi:sigma 54-interacting transcriptional regulator [candidate division KSB1 bacterium]